MDHIQVNINLLIYPEHATNTNNTCSKQKYASLESMLSASPQVFRYQQANETTKKWIPVYNINDLMTIDKHGIIRYYGTYRYCYPQLVISLNSLSNL